MEIGISTASLFGKCLTEDSFDYIKKIGARKCEVFLCTFSEYTKEFANVLLNNLNGIEVHSVHVLTNQIEPTLFNKYKRTREDSEKLFRDACYSAKTIGAKYYTFHGPILLKNIEYKYDFVNITKRLNELAEIANEYGIKIAYENVHWAFSKTPEYFKKLNQFDPNVCYTLDIKQAMQAGYNYNDYLPYLKHKLKTVHVCDYDDNKNLLIPGRGKVDFIDLFRRLKDAEYDGPVMIEVYENGFKEMSELKESFDFLNDALERAIK